MYQTLFSHADYSWLRRAVPKHLRRLIICLLLGTISFAAALLAQTAGTGAIAGSITDPSGASISEAQVKAINEATGEVRTAVSTASGNYTVALLLPGLYTLEISKTGFKLAQASHVSVVVTETTTFNVRMELGQIADKIIVEAQAEQLQTQSSALGEVTSGEQVRTLPLVTRNYTQIISLNPGVAADVTDAGAIGRGNVGLGGAPIVSNGGWQADNNVQMNGVGINDLQSSGYFSGGVAIPNPDTIQEFKVQTGQYDAAYGRNAGANVDVVTKGGSNDLHGAAWEFFRNDDLNANTFFRNAASQPRPVLKQNQFGFDLGGPIRRDKLFFFTSYQGTRQRNGLDPSCSSSVTSPPITNDRSAAALGQLFAGQRGVIQTALGGVGPAIASDGSNINPVALALLQLKGPNGQYIIPTPQKVDTTKPFESQGFSAFSVACPFTEDQFMTNADWQLSDKSKIEGRFFFANSDTTFSLPQANLGGGTPPGFPVALTNDFRNFTLTHTYIFSSALVNRVEIGFHRTLGLFQQSKVFSFSQVGATVPSFDNTIPAIGLDFGSSTGLSLGGNGQTVHLAQNVYTFQDSLSWNHGRHAFRFGAGVTREQLNEVGFHYLAGALYLSWADFLLGLDANGNGTAPFAPFGLATSNVIGSLDLPGFFDRAWRVWETNLYIQDDFKVTSRLTLNLGFRYDRIGDIADALGRNASFDVRLANPNPPASGTLAGYLVSSNYSGGAIPPGVTQVGNEFGGYGNKQNTWNPRVGFAWRLPRTERFVLRGGYGIYHSRYTGQPFLQLLTGAPFAQLRELVGGANAAATDQVPLPLAVPSLPSFPAYSSNPNSPPLQTTIFDPRFQPPMTQEYSLGLQTQLPGGFILETGYSGARGLHLIQEGSINQAQLASTANPIRGQTTNTLANIPLRVPFQGWDPALMQQIESSGSSWYNALLVGLNKRLGHGLTSQISYTFSRDLSTNADSTTGPNGGSSYGDQDHPKQRYGPDSFIREHRFIANFTYQLPGPKNTHSLLGEAIGGWMVAGVATVQSGHPLTLTYNHSGGKPSIFGTAFLDRPSLSGKCQPGQYVSPGSVESNLGGSKTYINTSCFTAPAVFSADDPVGVGFGNAGVGILEGPGQQNYDLSLIKKFPLSWPREGTALEFRSEFFNAFNHPQFGDPDTEFTSPTFGQITTTVVSPRVLQFALKLSF
jgi:hypothetical protein